jgi:hypothetical protein
MQLVPRQVDARNGGLGASQNCRAAILAATDKETAAKIAALQLAAGDTPATTETEVAARLRAGHESMRLHFQLREEK